MVIQCKEQDIHAKLLLFYSLWSKDKLSVVRFVTVRSVFEFYGRINIGGWAGRGLDGLLLSGLIQILEEIPLKNDYLIIYNYAT